MKQVLNKEINKHHKKIAQLRQKVFDIQDACAHEGLIKVPKANAGNWCRDDDSYWYECTCPVCGKFWTEDQ